MTTWTSEDKEEAYRKKVEDAPYHPGYEDAVVYPTVIVDSGASVKTLADFIEHETSVEKMRKHIDMLGKEILRLKKENAQLKREVEGLMDGRC